MSERGEPSGRPSGARRPSERADAVMLGTNLPEHLIGTDPGALQEFLAAIEDLGYGYVTVGDHVVGADLSVRPDWKPYLGKEPIYDQHTPWHEPLVLFGYLAALTRTLELATGILISPQRQTALLAKQAAEVDYEALGVSFRQRGRILEEQLVLLRELWTQELVEADTPHHTLHAVGINPLPVQRPIPLWLGGQSEVALRRVGRFADGWFPYYPAFVPDQILTDLATIRGIARDAGRDPSGLGLEGAIYFHDPRFEEPPGAQPVPATIEEGVERARWWKGAGATRYWVTAPWADLGPEETGVRVPGKRWSGIEARIRALEEFRDALGPDY
jgi:alkanesulfonate monooxygenase SsuD/methylene tetrahydromethanopterin reductase-like flavin-dependent oxidoreductase (luciferase family)